MLHRPQDHAYKRGRWGEKVTLGYLPHKKLKLLEKNFRSSAGEVDLIRQYRDIIAFVEVRYWPDNIFYAAPEFIDQEKYRRIIQTSHQYLSSHSDASQQDCRLDVVTLLEEQKI